MPTNPDNLMFSGDAQKHLVVLNHDFIELLKNGHPIDLNRMSVEFDVIDDPMDSDSWDNPRTISNETHPIVAMRIYYDS